MPVSEMNTWRATPSARPMPSAHAPTRTIRRGVGMISRELRSIHTSAGHARKRRLSRIMISPDTTGNADVTAS